MSLSRSQRKKLRKEGVLDNIKSGLNLGKIQPKTENQEIAFRHFSMGENLILHGYPGTGKTFIALYLAFDEMFNYGNYDKILVVRSAVPSREIGFLKGGPDDKISVYEPPYKDLVGEIFERSDAYDILKCKRQIEFVSTSFVRGLTFDNTIIIVDEAQNMSEMELHTILTRVGFNTRFIICGDLGQDDLTSERYMTETGLGKTMDILKSVPGVKFIDFGPDDILRSDFVKEYILAKVSYELRTGA